MYGFLRVFTIRTTYLYRKSKESVERSAMNEMVDGKRWMQAEQRILALNTAAILLYKA